MDIVADSLTKIRNAIIRKAPKVNVKKSGLIEDILNVMKKEGYITDIRDNTDNPYQFTVVLKYKSGKPAIVGLQRISRLSRRVYVKVDDIPSVFNNMGISIITTSRGVMTGNEAKSLGIGGELICTIW